MSSTQKLTPSSDRVNEVQIEARETDIDTSNVNERKLKWKLDFRIMPLLISIFFLASMGRSDIGNAKNAGMEEELEIDAKMYANIASLFYLGYTLGQLPGTLLLRKLGPPYQFAGAMFSWGLLTIGCALIHDYPSLLTLRVFIGLAEAFIQGAVFYLSFWYKNEELGTRGALLFSTSALAGAFNGLLAYAIQHNFDGSSGWRAWRYIFLIEGSLPVGWAAVVAIFLPAIPEHVRWGFSPSERAKLVARSKEAHNTGDHTVNPKLILRVLADPQFWGFAILHSGLSMCVSSTSNFLPAIMEGLGYDDIQAQLMTVIVYAVMFVTILVTCRLSDLAKLRAPFILGGCAVAAIGYIMLLASQDLTTRFVATCLVAAGANAPVVVDLAWMASANVGYTYRGSAIALINIVSHLVAIGGNQAFKDPPYYRVGLTVSLVVLVVVAIVVILQVLYFRHMNSKKRREQNTEGAAVMREFTVDQVGNRHPDFYFTF